MNEAPSDSNAAGLAIVRKTGRHRRFFKGNLVAIIDIASLRNSKKGIFHL